MIILDMDRKNIEVIIPETSFNIDNNALVIQIKMMDGMVDYDLNNKNITSIFSETGIEKGLLNVIDGIIQLPITSDAIKVGYNKIQLLFRFNDLINNKQVLEASPIMRLYIKAGLKGSISLESASIVSDLIERSKGVIESNDEVIRKTNEDIRISNELTRDNKESGRESNESTRESNESTRNNNESTRNNNESNRSTSESSRTTNESARNISESGRENNESARNISESGRENNESVRVSGESDRNDNESIRSDSEIVRTDNESLRKDNESARNISESARKTNESDRETSESSRNANESSRNTNEDSRKSSETSRIDNENSRETKEYARETSESIRVGNETSRNTSESARVSGESTRNTNETTRTNNESARETKESARNTSESTRINNESVRETKESARVSGESGRVSNESSRISGEESRNTNESNRGINEDVRNSNEISRNDNESIRMSRENDRLDNENIRNSNELSRNTNFNNALTNVNTAITEVNTVKESANDVVNNVNNIVGTVGNSVYENMQVLMKKMFELNGLTFNPSVGVLDKVYNSAYDLVEAIKVGWNLGNALENINTANPYEVGIYNKAGYSAWLAVLNKGSKYFSGMTAAGFTGDPKATTLNWTISSIPESEYANLIGSISVQIANWNLGPSVGSKLGYTITNATIKKSGGVAQELTTLNNTTQYVSKNSNNVCDFYIPLVEPGFTTMGDLAMANIVMTITIIEFLVPSAPKSKEDWYESQTGNAPITKEALMEIKKKGFNLIRFPISWFQHETGGVFETSWLARIKQVVDWCMELDLFCIINTHHDDRVWLYPYSDTTAFNNMLTQFNNYWTIIATMFKDYDQRLIFEAFNEMLDTNDSWSSPTLAEQTGLNTVAQNFVNTVRATGSVNAERILSINTYGAMCTYAYFVLPTDTVVDKLLVQVHLYDPQEFCWPSQLVTNGKTATKIYDEATHGPILTNLFSYLWNKFVSQGIPVIIGEFAAYNKINTADRILYVNSYITKAKAKKIKCVWWDDGGLSNRTNDTVTNGSLFNRTSLTWWNETVADALVSAASTEVEDSEAIPPTEISISSSTLTFSTSDPQTLIANKIPSTTTYLTEWISSNMSIAQVSSAGIVTPVTNGTCIITAKLGNLTATCTVTVNAFNNTVSITVNPASASMTTITPLTLSAVLDPTYSTDAVTWSSGDTAIAMAINNVIIPIADGVTDITAKSNNKTSKCTVTVDLADGPIIYYGSQVGLGPDFVLPAGYNYFTVSKNGSLYLLTISTMPIKSGVGGASVRIQGQTIQYRLINGLWVPSYARLTGNLAYLDSSIIQWTNHAIYAYNVYNTIYMEINYIQSNYE